uniref:Translocating chain-associated membrane protein n=1 Tax=Hirondellea gigas TaxID=1518452 RepID=A0A2P2HXK6_9CRUS
MPPIKPVKKVKNPPIVSHEFVIQNHGDIVSCIAMVIVLGLMFQVSSPLATIFIVMQHAVNQSSIEFEPDQEYYTQYTNGVLDLAGIFFYTVIVIVVHAIVQDYVLDRLNRKLHLSKTKHSKFNEAGQLLLFTSFAAAWGLQIMLRDESMTGITSLWSNYPEDHARLTFRMKFYFIIQLAYWIHNFPELYFQKTKREEILGRIWYATFHLAFVGAAYYLNLTHLALVLLVLHYITEATLHGSKMLFYAEMTKHSAKGFKAYNTMFVAFRLISLILAIITIQFGLGSSTNPGLDVETGNYNTPLVRMVSLVSVCAIQAFMLWNFLTYHLRMRREVRNEQQAAQKKKQQQTKATKKSKRGSDEEVSLLPEVDQNTRRRR